MKTILFSTVLLLVGLGFSGCAVGPNYRTVINPFDWRDISPSETANLTVPTEAAAKPPMQVASTTP